MKINKKKIKKILIEQGKENFDVDLFLKNYPEKINNDLKKCYKTYLKKRDVLNVEFDGVTLEKIMENLHGHFFTALRDMDKLMSTKKGTEEREQWKKIITNPRSYE
jgi:hypothetical protein